MPLFSLVPLPRSVKKTFHLVNLSGTLACPDMRRSIALTVPDQPSPQCLLRDHSHSLVIVTDR